MIRIVMTDAEVREAIKERLDNHGVPSGDYALTASVRPDGYGVDMTGKVASIKVTVETEAPHMEGPYR